MEVKQFINELKVGFESVDFVEQINIELLSVTYVKIKIKLKKERFISIWYNAVRHTLSFSLIIDNKRKWGLDFDNRIGWHEHTTNNPDLHVAIENHTIAEIIDKLINVWITFD